MYRKLYKKIAQADVIYLYRHIDSDYDALGSQFGLKALIEDNFTNLQVICMGKENSDLNRRMGISFSKEGFKTQKNSLAIVLDTANSARIDGEGWQDCDDLVKIDHHIVVESYGHLNIEDANASSTSELVVRFYEENKERLNLSQKAASFLFYGIIGDTNRFMYESATTSTLRAAAVLLEAGINKQAIFEAMYVKNRNDLRVTQFILNHYVYEDGVAYYILTQKDLETLQISREQGSLFVGTLADIEDIHVWAAITYDKEKNQYRVSMRSRHVPVQPVAIQFGGGGHLYASGARLDSLDDLPKMIEALKEAVKNEISI